MQGGQKPHSAKLCKCFSPLTRRREVCAGQNHTLKATARVTTPVYIDLARPSVYASCPNRVEEDR